MTRSFETRHWWNNNKKKEEEKKGTKQKGAFICSVELKKEN